MNSAALQLDSTLVDAIEQIENSRRRLTFVVDQTGKLVGTLTDGDIRRCLLKGGSLETLAVDACNQSPQIAEPDTPTRN